MADKRDKNTAVFVRGGDGRFDPRYLAFFDCFNQQLFYEAHEVLEPLWLSQRGCADGDFFKGLIQLAGAFVHVQKRRPGPAIALLKLAHAHLAKYPAPDHDLDVARVLRLADGWIALLHQAQAGESSSFSTAFPRLDLLGPTR